MSAPRSQLGKRTAPGAASGLRFKRQRTWADKVAEKQTAKGTEEDQHRVAQRQKQIDLGKDTLAYDCYVSAVAREMRKPQHPMTPLATQKCSRRSFVGQVKRWRKMLFDFNADLDAAKVETRTGENSCPYAAAKSGSICNNAQVEAEGSIANATPRGNSDRDDEASSPQVLSTIAGSDEGGPSYVDDLSAYEDDDGVVLDDNGDVISITPIQAEVNGSADGAPAVETEKGADTQDRMPEECSIFDVF
jgi:Histone RNA hairpin-binding protein RNA-binding domain